VNKISTGRWYGTVTLDKLEELGAAIERLFTGKRYTWVAVNYHVSEPRPEVRTGQRLSPEKALNGKAVKVWFSENIPDYGGITVVDSYGVWGIQIDRHREGYPYVVLEHDSLYIEHFALAGHKLMWKVVIEQEEYED